MLSYDNTSYSYLGINCRKFIFLFKFIAALSTKIFVSLDFPCDKVFFTSQNFSSFWTDRIGICFALFYFYFKANCINNNKNEFYKKIFVLALADNPYNIKIFDGRKFRLKSYADVYECKFYNEILFSNIKKPYSML